MAVESLTPITDAELLSAVKSVLNITGAQFDKTLQFYIEDVKGYLTSAGVSADVLGSTLAVGCISRGVADLWNYGNGDTKLSEYFYQRAEQLRAKTRGQAGQSNVSYSVRLTTITLLMSDWEITEDGDAYYQKVDVAGVTSRSRIDLQPTPEQLLQLQEDETALTAANFGGIVTVYAIGTKPTVDYTMQATITEVVS